MVKISRADKRFSRLVTTTLAAANILERYDLQEYIFNSPEAFCQELGQNLTDTCVLAGRWSRPGLPTFPSSNP